MSNINIGSQDVLWKFRYPVVGIHNQKALKNLLHEGIYEGMNVTIYNSIDRKVQVSAGTVLINGRFNTANIVLSKITFELPFIIDVPQLVVNENMVLYLTYEYVEVVQNFANVLYMSKNDFISNRPENCVALCEIEYDSNSYISKIIYGTVRMERSVNTINEYGFSTNHQGDKFLRTTGNIDRDIILPNDSDLAILENINIKDGVTLTIPNDTELSVITNPKYFAGTLNDILINNNFIYTLTLDCKFVVANLTAFFPNVSLWIEDSNKIKIKNDSGNSILIGITYIGIK